MSYMTGSPNSSSMEASTGELTSSNAFFPGVPGVGDAHMTAPNAYFPKVKGDTSRYPLSGMTAPDGMFSFVRGDAATYGKKCKCSHGAVGLIDFPDISVKTVAIAAAAAAGIWFLTRKKKMF